MNTQWRGALAWHRDEGFGEDEGYCSECGQHDDGYEDAAGDLYCEGTRFRYANRESTRVTP